MSAEIHLLKGNDPVLLNDAARKLVDRLVGDAARDEVLAEFTGDDDDLGAVVLAAQTVSMFGDRVVVAHHLGRFGRSKVDDEDGDEDEPSRSVDGDLTPLLEYLGDPAPDTSLVLVWSPPATPQMRRGPVPRKLTDAVKRAGGTVSDHGTPAGKGASKWLEGQLDASSVTLSGPARRVVQDRLGEDVSRLGGVLRVLEATFGPGAGPLDPDDVEPFLGESGGVPPWDLTDAIDAGRVTDAVTNLRRMVHGGGRHPLQVMATLNTHFARMLRLDGAGIRTEQDAAALLGMKGSTFPARKALDQSRKLGSARIARAVQLLATADAELRGVTATPSDQLLEVLVARLAAMSGAAVSSRRR